MRRPECRACSKSSDRNGLAASRDVARLAPETGTSRTSLRASCTGSQSPLAIWALRSLWRHEFVVGDREAGRLQKRARDLNGVRDVTRHPEAQRREISRPFLQAAG